VAFVYPQPAWILPVSGYVSVRSTSVSAKIERYEGRGMHEGQRIGSVLAREKEYLSARAARKKEYEEGYLWGREGIRMKGSYRMRKKRRGERE
jgi:hypothetical protein